MTIKFDKKIQVFMDFSVFLPDRYKITMLLIAWLFDFVQMSVELRLKRAFERRNSFAKLLQSIMVNGSMIIDGSRYICNTFEFELKKKNFQFEIGQNDYLSVKYEDLINSVTIHQNDNRNTFQTKPKCESSFQLK